MKLIRLFLLVVISLLTFIILSHAAPGDLDTSFAGTGTRRIEFGFGEDLAYAAAAQADGKLVVVGSSGSLPSGGGNFSVVRYNTNDLLDPSFGDGGKVITPILGTDQNARANAVRIQADGKIVVAGTGDNGVNNVFALVRYLPDGSLDDSFGGGGITITDFGFGDASGMVLQTDGKILMAGSSFDGVSGGFALARYTTNGLLDTTFGRGTGKVFTPGNNNIRAYGLTLQADGKAVVVGVFNSDFAIYRYTTTGALDTTFGAAQTGKVFTHLGGVGAVSTASAVAIQPGNIGTQTPDKIIVAGQTELTRSHYEFAVACYGLDGRLDPSFGSGGIATAVMGPGDGFGDMATSLVVQGGGVQSIKLIVAGYTHVGASDVFCVARFNVGGTLDGSFNGNGKMLTAFGPGDSRAYGMAFVGGKLMVVGSSATSPGNTDFALARYDLQEGSLDTSFGNNGRMNQDVAGRSGAARGVAIQPDGRMIVTGSAENGLNTSFALTRLNQDGTLDATFGAAGKVVLLFGGAASEANAVALQPDGKILTAGVSADDFALARLNPNGTPDLSFGSNGIVTTSLAAGLDVVNAITLQSDGKIVLAGSSYNGVNDNFAIARYNPNGTPDATFNGNGRVITVIDAGGSSARAVKVQPDGKIVVAGYAAVGGLVNIAVVRYRSNGTLDTSFGSFGRVATAIGAAGSASFALAIQPDAKILVAGYTASGANVDIAVVRYNTNGVLDTSFDNDGIVTTPIGLSTDAGVALEMQGDGKFIVAGFTVIGANAEFAAVRYLPNGALDNSYGTGGRAVVDFGDDSFNTGSALALDSLGRAVIVGDGGGFFGVARLQGDPTLKILSIARLPNRHTVLTGVGVPNENHQLLGSTNMSSTSFGLVGSIIPDAAGHWQFEDPTAVSMPRRFYRLVLP